MHLLGWIYIHASNQLDFLFSLYERLTFNFEAGMSTRFLFGVDRRLYMVKSKFLLGPLQQSTDLQVHYWLSTRTEANAALKTQADPGQRSGRPAHCRTTCSTRTAASSCIAGASACTSTAGASC